MNHDDDDNNGDDNYDNGDECGDNGDDDKFYEVCVPDDRGWAAPGTAL